MMKDAAIPSAITIHVIRIVRFVLAVSSSDLFVDSRVQFVSQVNQSLSTLIQYGIKGLTRQFYGLVILVDQGCSSNRAGIRDRLVEQDCERIDLRG